MHSNGWMRKISLPGFELGSLQQMFFVSTAFVAVLVTGVVVLIAIQLVAVKKFNPAKEEFFEELSTDDERNETESLAEDSYQPRIQTRDTLRVKTSVQVVVLGDIGRSPRMQYHALSLLQHGARVDLIGFQESDIHFRLQSSARVSIIPLDPPPARLQTSNKLLFVLFGPLKVVWQTINLYRVLAYRTKPAEWLLVQNPPSIPVLAIAWVVSLLRNTKLVIDWHNFGWSVLALKLGNKHPLVLVAHWYEIIFSKGAYASFTVTNAMAQYLKRSVGIDARPLHDRPAEDFQPLSLEERRTFLEGLTETAQFASDIRNGSWKLLVSSTSWSADEDFSLLLDALVGYSLKASKDKSLPKVLAIITGKGPQRDYYLKHIKILNQQNKLSNVVILTAWLSRKDYASLLGAADLGVSLHQSTSGVDLPMKVVDMFGAGLPVVGWSKYESWPELVKEDVNGKGFTTAEGLERLLIQLFTGSGAGLDLLKKGALEEGKRRWDKEWKPVAGDLFRV